MSKYDNAKIYKLVDKSDEQVIYVGSTCNTLHNRFILHKSAAKKGTSKIYNYIRNKGPTNINIELIKNYPCKNRLELLKEENKTINYFKDQNLMNVYEAGSSTGKTTHEYYMYYSSKLTPEQIKQRNEKQKRYLEQNRQAINNKKRVIVHCECGKHYTKSNKINHERGKHHQKFITN